MNRQEFLLKCYDLRWTHSELEEDLDTLIQSEIDAHEAAQWKKCPENEPKEGDWYCEFSTGTPDVCYYDYELNRWSMNALHRKVIAFRPLPKHYQP